MINISSNFRDINQCRYFPHGRQLGLSILFSASIIVTLIEQPLELNKKKKDGCLLTQIALFCCFQCIFTKHNFFYNAEIIHLRPIVISMAIKFFFLAQTL